VRSSTAKGYGQAHRRARLIVLARDGYTCQWCGAPANEADHLGPKVPDPDRMVAACRSCNARRGLAKAIANRRARNAAATPGARLEVPRIARGKAGKADPTPTPPHPTPTPTPPGPGPGPSRRW